MSDNGDSIEVLKITLKHGSITVNFGQVNIALISHALRLANLELDNKIIASHSVAPEVKQVNLNSSIVLPTAKMPQGIMNKILGRPDVKK